MMKFMIPKNPALSTIKSGIFLGIRPPGKIGWGEVRYWSLFARFFFTLNRFTIAREPSGRRVQTMDRGRISRKVV